MFCRSLSTFTAAAIVAAVSVAAARLDAAPVIDFSQTTVERGFEPAVNPTGDPVDLRLDLMPGASWTQAFEVSMEMATTLRGVPQAPANPMNAGIRMLLSTDTAVEQGEAAGDRALVLTITSASGEMSMNGQPMPLPAGAGSPFAQIIGKRTVFRVDERGNPINLAELLGSQIGDSSSGIGMFGGCQSAMCFPDQLVCVGDTWTETAHLGGLPGAEVTTRCTLAEVRHGSARIHFEQHMVIPSEVVFPIPAQPAMPAVTINRMDATTTGEAWHVIATGRPGPARGRGTVAISAALPMPAAPGQSGQPMTTDITMQMDFAATPAQSN